MSEKNTDKQDKTHSASSTHVPPMDTSAISAFTSFWRQETTRMFDEVARASERSYQEAGRALDEMNRIGAAQLQWSRDMSRALLNNVRASF